MGIPTSKAPVRKVCCNNLGEGYSVKAGILQRGKVVMKTCVIEMVCNG